MMTTVTTQLTLNLHLVSLGPYQAYLWLDRDSTTLIDTGAVGSSRMIDEALASVGRSRGDLHQIVVTHAHDDHAGSVRELVADSTIEVIAHRDDAPIIKGEVTGTPPNFTEAEKELHAVVAAGLAPAPPARVDREVVDGDVLSFGGGAVVLSTPGHTDGSIAIYLPEHQVLFTGDSIAEHQGQVIPGVFNIDTGQLRDSIARLSGLDVRTACFGHGTPAVDDAADALDGLADLVQVSAG